MNRIFDRDNWREIGQTLARNKTRTFLTAFGIFWGTAMLALLTGGASGFEGIMSRQFAGMATNMAGIWTNATNESYHGFNKGSSWNMTQTDIRRIRSTVPYIDNSSTMLNFSTQVTYGDKTKQTQVMGVEADYFKISNAQLISGRLLNASDDYAHAKAALIGRDLAPDIFGDDDPIGKYVNIGGVAVQIVGVVTQKSDASIGGDMRTALIIPGSTMNRMFNLGETVYFFIFTVENGHSLNELKPSIQRAICAGHPISPTDVDAVGYMDVGEMFDMINGVFLVISLLAWFIGIGTLIAGVIGVGNIMWIIVKERTTEIGIRRAIGARPLDIIMQILLEGSVLTTIAGVAGISFATIILGIVDTLTSDPVLGSAGFQMSFATAIAILLTFIILGLLASLVPATRAMRIKPIEAINDK